MEFFKKQIQYIVAFSIILCSIIVFIYVKKQDNENQQIKFISTSKQIGQAIIDRMDAYREVLLGGIGMFHGSDFVSRNDWKEYVNSLQIETYLPGIQAIGYSKILKPNELENHIETIRKEGFPKYKIYPIYELRRI